MLEAGKCDLVSDDPDDCTEKGVRHDPSAIIEQPAGDKPYAALASQVTADGRSFLQVIQTLIEGPVLWSPVLQGGLLLSTRGGDFELTIGQDLAIGYAAHDRERVQLYLTESFTFRVLQPNAAVEFRGRHT